MKIQNANKLKPSKNEISQKLYWVGTDPVTGIMKVSCDFRDIMGHSLDNVMEVWAHSSEAARIEYNALRV